VHVSAEPTDLIPALAADSIGIEPWRLESEWVASILRSTLAERLGPGHYLIGVDRLGSAHPLAGSLARARVAPPILEALESPGLWGAVEPRRSYGPSELHALHPAWPPDGAPGARFYKDGPVALGALLEDAGRAAGDAATQMADDALIELIMRHWSVTREAAALGAFTHALVTAARAGVIGVDTTGRVTYLSPLGEEILGIRATQAVGADCARVIRPAVEEPHPILQGLAGKLEQVEFYVTDRQDRDVPVWLSVGRIVDAQGQIQGLAGVFRDLTEERAMDQEARRRERLAVIGELAAGAAHEIRNPLTGIANAAQVLQMRLGAEESHRRMADLILGETQRLDRIITSLLGFARPGQPRMRETRIEEIVARALELDQPLYDRAGVRCEHKVAGQIPPIYVDSEQIQQVLVNLMRNAVEAMPAGGLLSVEVAVVRRRLHLRRKLGRRATDRVSLPSQGPLRRFVRVTVKDTGKGIPADIVGRIFDPFFTTRSRGTGLGLSVSQSIVQEHGGFISVQSVQGKGTVFEVDLPVERREGERREPN
jgi:PAS domain S-box-containing protein